MSILPEEGSAVLPAANAGETVYTLTNTALQVDSAVSAVGARTVINQFGEFGISGETSVIGGCAVHMFAGREDIEFCARVETLPSSTATGILSLAAFRTMMGVSTLTWAYASSVVWPEFCNESTVKNVPKASLGYAGLFSTVSGQGWILLGYRNTASGGTALHNRSSLQFLVGNLLHMRVMGAGYSV